MPDLNSIKKEITQMAKSALMMWQVMFEAFMEHDTDLIATALLEEDKLNNWQKELTAALINIGKATAVKEEKENVTTYTDVVADLELIGDYCKDILERIEIKIEEKLLFSEDAVKEYTDLYQKTKDALEEIVFALDKDNLCLVKDVLSKDSHIDTLVDQYRSQHNQRLLNGVCTPLACNMFLNMLDYTAAVYYHTKKIARNLLKIKQ